LSKAFIQPFTQNHLKFNFMRKTLLFLLLLLTMQQQQLFAADYYWVGGTGNWSDINHWVTVSGGGTNHSIVPSAGDNVIFDANSGFTTASRTVTLDANGFCNNMTWGNVTNNPIFTRTTSSSYTVQVWNNLALSPTVNYTAQFVFRGSNTGTLTTNGRVLGTLGFEIDKAGASLQVVDSFISTLGNITLTDGALDITGKKMNIRSFTSNNTNTRALQMNNADINASYNWDYRGTNKTLNATGSVLTVGVYIFTDGGTYNKVSSNGLDNNNFGIDNTTFSHLTFIRPSNVSYAQINDGNTVDTLIFSGQGRIYNNNTVGRIYYNMRGMIAGTNNTIGYLENVQDFGVTTTGTNTVDSLLLAANHVATFKGTFNINRYLQAEGLPCDAFTEINGDTTSPGLFFGAGAVVDVENLLLSGVRAYGPVTPIAVTGIDGDGNVGFVITQPPTATGATLYWVGGAGDWNDRTHWSTTSGGTGGSCIPFINDNVVFDAGSGLVSGSNVVTTSGNAYCHDMTWAPTAGTATFNKSAAKLNMYGSLVLNPAVTMNATLDLIGSETGTMTTNGSSLGTLGLNINRTGSGGLTLVDDWSNTSGSINFLQGRMMMPDRIVAISLFAGSVAYPRHLDISNATITVSNRWTLTGNNKTMNASGAHITSGYIFEADGLHYPWVDLTYANINQPYNISNTTFGQLTFTATIPTSTARISQNNTIRRLEFKGAGSIANGGNSIDSLILADSRNYLFAGTNTINKYLHAVAPACNGLTEMKGNATGTLAFAVGAVIDLQNIYMQNLTATGPITPIAFDGADAGGNAGWTISSAAGSPRYWIGGAGDWNDNSHWSTVNGGTGGACIPTVYDDVYFTAASGFTTASKTVTINNGNAYARNVNWTGAANSPVWIKAVAWNLEAWGDSIILNPAATFTVSPLTLKGANATYLKNSVSGNFDVRIDKPGGSLTMLNNYSNTATDILINTGTFNAPLLTLSLSSIDNSGLANPSAININGATVTTSALWRYSGTVTQHTLNATNATISTPVFTANGLSYDNVNVSGVLNSNATLSNTTINRLTFTNSSSTSAIGVSGTNNTIGTLEFKGSGGMYGTGNVINTLIFFPGNTYTFNNGTNTTITGAWYGSGTPCRLTEIVSSSSTLNATITLTAGSVNFDYVRVRRITAAASGSGVVPFVAREHSIDQGNNSNWSVAPYNGSSPIYGLGPDVTLPATGGFPYTLKTTGFFGSPLSTYTWNDNSTLDSLVVTDTGRYSVVVSFIDGCSVRDTIRISRTQPLPVTLESFNVLAQNCNVVLNWTIGSASGFSSFVAERSSDGNNYDKVGRVAYQSSLNKYSFTDESTGKDGMYYYRLKLEDINGAAVYSPVRKASITCDQLAVRVYPTITSDYLHITIPGDSREARIRLFNASGQPVLTDNSHRSVNTLNIATLPDGLYILQVSKPNETSTFRIIKQ